MIGMLLCGMLVFLFGPGVALAQQDLIVFPGKGQSQEQMEGNLILQGVQNGKGWSMVITEATGKTTIAVSDNQVGFVVFGACIGH